MRTTTSAFDHRQPLLSVIVQAYAAISRRTKGRPSVTMRPRWSLRATALLTLTAALALQCAALTSASHCSLHCIAPAMR